MAQEPVSFVKYDRNSRVKPGSLVKWIIKVIQGMLIGGGAILPGISGGVLCVSFGIYQPMMSVIAHPKRNLGKYWPLLLPVGIGWVLGFFFFANAIELMFSFSETLSIWLFIGLIAGTLPALYQDSGKQGRTKGGYIGMVIAFVLFLAYMLFAQYGGISANITPNAGWFFFCGILWGLSVIVPGMTSSSVLIAMGLFMPMTSGVAAMDMSVLVPMGAGVIVVVVVMARLVDYLFRTYYTIAYHCIIGFVLASTVVLIPLEYSGIQEILLCAVLAVAGFFVAWAMEKSGKDDEITENRS